jgi:hypothetical protein
MTVNINWDTTTNKETLKTLLKEYFDNTDRPAISQYKEVFKEVKVSDEYERYLRASGPTGVQSLADGANIPLVDPTMGGTKDVTQARYGLGFKITSGMKKFEKYGQMKKWSRKLGVAQREYKDVAAAALWNSATATTYTGFDSLALASNSHTCLEAGNTYDNYLDGALTAANLESALVYFHGLKDDNGDLIIVDPDLLVVNKNLQFDADELLNSKLKPGVADNDINALSRFGLKYFVYSRLTATTSWFLIAKNHEDYGMIMNTSQEPDFKMQDAPDTSRSTIVTSDQWFRPDILDPRMVYVGDL